MDYSTVMSEELCMNITTTTITVEETHDADGDILYVLRAATHSRYLLDRLANELDCELHFQKIPFFDHDEWSVKA